MSNEFIEEFNELLSGERSAVETYDLALKTVADGAIQESLNRCRISHVRRVDKLAGCVKDVGGTPVNSSGVWGPFAAFSQKSAGSETDALALLEQSEAERLVQYEAQQKILPPPVLKVLSDDLLPAQHETHLIISALLKSLLPVQ